MTRKEPQFNDDLSAPISVPESREPRDSAAQTQNQQTSAVRSVSDKPRSNGLLWLFVIVSLCVSFGMAFFGLEEAGRYQAALAKTETQAKELEATIQRLNDVQSQGIGELAQSDAQMRKMVQSVEARLKSDVASDVENIARQVESDTVAISTQLKSLEKNVESATKTSRALQSKLDESVALLSEQINTERTRIDAVSETRQAVMTLSQDLRSLNEAVLALDGRLERVDNGRLVNQQTVKTIQLAVDGINEQLSQLANANNALLGLEVLSEQVDRLTQQANQQQEIIDAVDASRKQLTQRIIDLNERINSAPTPGEQ